MVLAGRGPVFSAGHDFADLAGAELVPDLATAIPQPTDGGRTYTFQLRKSLVLLRRVVLPMREVVNTVVRGVADVPESAEMQPYFADLYDHVLRATEWTESLRDLAGKRGFRIGGECAKWSYP